MRPRDRWLATAALLLAAGAATAGEYHNPTLRFSLTLPDEWVEVPRPFLDAMNAEAARRAPAGMPVRFEAGFQLRGTTPRNPVTKNGFVTNSVSCQVSDLTIDQFRKFMQEIETASKVVVVTRLDVRRDMRTKEKLDATLEVSTYSKQPPTKGEGGGSGSAAGSAAKTGG